jgi:hypothetical protein
MDDHGFCIPVVRRIHRVLPHPPGLQSMLAPEPVFHTNRRCGPFHPPLLVLDVGVCDSEVDSTPLDESPAHQLSCRTDGRIKVT